MTSFSRGVVNNQCFTSFGKASVRVKLGRTALSRNLPHDNRLKGEMLFMRARPTGEVAKSYFIKVVKVAASQDAKRLLEELK